jgi:hypothetical protein
MAWHVMTWFTYKAESYYEYPFAVHFFTSTKISPQDATDLALMILSRDFGINVNNAKASYVGYEELPVTLQRESHIAVAVGRGFAGFEITSVSGEIAEADAKSILEYRLSRFTVDIDEYKHPLLAKYALATALDTALALSKNVKVYRSRQGYHIKATLEKPVSFEELIELRRKAFDDPERVEIDLAYHKAGLTFLTNMVFNEKCVNNGDKFLCFEEREISLGDAVVARDSHVKCKFPNIELVVEGISVKLTEKLIQLTGRFKHVTRSFVENVVNEIERMCNNEETVKAAINAFKDNAVGECDVVDLGLTLYVIAPETLVGRLVGRNGAKAKSAERALGKRVFVLPRGSTSASEVYASLVRTAVRRALSK